MITHSNMESRSVTDIPEPELCRWLVSDPTVSAPLCRDLELAPSSLPAFSVPTICIMPNAEGPGDIDVLVSASLHLDIAVAIEVKRVKIDADSFHTGMPGKLQDLRRPNVGLAFMELTQPVDKAIADAGSIGIRVDCRPEVEMQPEAVTVPVRAYFEGFRA